MSAAGGLMINCSYKHNISMDNETVDESSFEWPFWLKLQVAFGGCQVFARASTGNIWLFTFIEDLHFHPRLFTFIEDLHFHQECRPYFPLKPRQGSSRMRERS